MNQKIIDKIGGISFWVFFISIIAMVWIGFNPIWKITITSFILMLLFAYLSLEIDKKSKKTKPLKKSKFQQKMNEMIDENN